MSDIGAVQVVFLGFGHQNAGFAFVSAIEIHLQGIICKDIFTQVSLQGYIYTGYLTKIYLHGISCKDIFTQVILSKLSQYLAKISADAISLAAA